MTLTSTSGGRNRRSGVEDRWTKTVPDEHGNKPKVPSANHGKGKRWRARYVDDQGREHAKGFARKSDAQAWLNEISATQVSGAYIAPRAGLITVDELHAKWLGIQGHLKATTVATRAFAWSAHVAPRWAKAAAADVRTSDVGAWVQDMTVAGAGAATVENALSVLRQILAMAVEDRRIARNPCAGVKPPRRRHRRRGYLRHEQVELLAAELPAADATVVRFLAYTGLRWGEMAALRVGASDMLRRRVHIHEAVAEVGGRLVWSTPKSHERRSVPFPTFLAEELAALMVGKGREDLVFTAPEGGVLRVSTWRPRVLAPAVRRLAQTVSGFPVVTPHDLRHTAASLAISAGANPKAVQTMLGHASAVLTLDTYADLFPDDLEMVSAALDDARRTALEQSKKAPADALRTDTRGGPNQDHQLGPLTCDNAGRGGGVWFQDIRVGVAVSGFRTYE
jgi:integrase